MKVVGIGGCPVGKASTSIESASILLSFYQEIGLRLRLSRLNDLK